MQQATMAKVNHQQREHLLKTRVTNSLLVSDYGDVGFKHLARELAKTINLVSNWTPLVFFPFLTPGTNPGNKS